MSQNGIRDARKLGYPKMMTLGVQHMFAMFGATVLVPMITGLSVSATLLFAGLGTLLFHFLTKGKIPAFLGSSFAFLGGYAAITEWVDYKRNAAGELVIDEETGEFIMEKMVHSKFLPYACVGVFCAGLVYLLLAALIRTFGAQKVMRFFPPIVTGPIIISIGITLASSAIDNCMKSWPIALVAIAVVIICNIWGKGMIKIIPILLGVIASYAVAAIFGDVDFTKVAEAKWIGLPFGLEDTVFSLFTSAKEFVYGVPMNGPEAVTLEAAKAAGEGFATKGGLILTSIITIMPIALATIVEHIGDVCAISSTVEENFIEEPGLHRTMLGDGLATSLAALFGAPANTTYGENTGVLELSKVYDPKVVRIAAYIAILFSFCPKFAALVSSMPDATIGGVSLILYGMISAVGVRNVVENKVDFTKSRNVIIAALILVLALGIKFSAAGAISFMIGKVTISHSGLAVAAIVGIVLNAVLPGNDYVFGVDKKGDTSVNFKV